MNSTNEQVLDILTKALNGEGIGRIENWPTVLKELKDHAVYCLPFEAIRKSGYLSDEEMVSYQAMCFQNIAKTIQVLSEQNKLVDLFEGERIPFVVLKGTSASIYYPNPVFRSMGDIDIIVKPEDLGRAYAVLKKEYECCQTFDENPRHAGFMTKSGVEIELHKYFTLGKRTEKKSRLDNLIFAGIDKREWKEIRGFRFPCLPADQNGIVLLDHINQHLQGQGIGYRQLIDFRQFVEAEKENINHVLDVAEAIGLRKLAEALLCMYEMYMGVACTVNTTIEQNVVNELVSECSDFGNFGKKNAKDNGKKAETVIKRFKNPLRFMAVLQKFGRIHWKLSDNCIYLRPFAWIYQIGYYAKQIKINGGIRIFWEGRNKVQIRKALFTKLELED